MITHRLISGQWVQVQEPKRPDRDNFLIVCDYGDWSGFRTLENCLKQIPDAHAQRPDGFYRIEER